MAPPPGQTAAGPPATGDSPTKSQTENHVSIALSHGQCPYAHFVLLMDAPLDIYKPEKQTNAAQHSSIEQVILINIVLLSLPSIAGHLPILLQASLPAKGSEIGPAAAPIFALRFADQVGVMMR